MFHIISSSAVTSLDFRLNCVKLKTLGLVYKSRKRQKVRRRRFSLTKFIFLFSTPLVYHYKSKFSLQFKKLRFYKIANQLRFGNVSKKTGAILQKRHNVTLRHLEINRLANSFTVLPVSYLYFYSFLLDQTFLWKSILVELQLYYR